MIAKAIEKSNQSMEEKLDKDDKKTKKDKNKIHITTDYNLFTYLIGNRDIDQSIKAYQDNERQVAYTDIARGTTRSVISQGQAIGQAQQGMLDAKNERRTASLKAAGYLPQGLYGLQTIIG